MKLGLVKLGIWLGLVELRLVLARFRLIKLVLGVVRF